MEANGSMIDKRTTSRFFTRRGIDLRVSCLLLAIFLLALFLRILNILEFRKYDPFFEHAIPGLDMYHYSQWIADILNTKWVNRNYVPFTQGPLYPYAVAFAMQLFGTSMLWIKMLQATMGSVSCLLAYAVGRRVFNVRAGIISALLMSVYGMFLLYEAQLLMETMITFLNLVAILALLTAREKDRFLFYLLAGVGLGLSVICRPNIVLFVPLALAWMWMTATEQKNRRKAATAAFFLLGMTITIMPVTLKNYLVGGEFVPVCKQGGLNFYVGNCYEATGTLSYNESVMKVAPGMQYMPVTEISGIDWYAELWKEIRDNPPRFFLHFIRLLWKKFLFFWGACELPNNINYYLSKKFSLILRLPLLEYWQVFPFAVVGILAGVKKRGSILLLLFMFAFMSSILLLFVVARYRLPMVPFLIVFAGYAPVWWYEKVKLKDFKRILLSLVIFVPVGAFSIGTRCEYVRAGDYFNLGLAYQARWLYQSAAGEYEAALKVNPAFTPARNNLVHCYLAVNNLEDALAASMEGVRIEPYNAENFYCLALVLVKKGQIQPAIENLERSIVLDPQSMAARKMLARLYSRVGKYHRAEAEWQKVLEMNGEDKEAVKKLENLQKSTAK